MCRNRKVTIGLIVLNSLCAIIWGALSVDDIINKNNTAIMYLHILCTVLWAIVAIMNYLRYRNEHRNDEQ